MWPNPAAPARESKDSWASLKREMHISLEGDTKSVEDRSQGNPELEQKAVFKENSKTPPTTLLDGNESEAETHIITHRK